MKKEVKEGIVITIVVILFLLIVYIVTALFGTKEIGNFGKKTTTTTSSLSVSTSKYSNTIIAGNIFNRSESEYMVILFSDEDAKESIKSAVESYSGDTKLYVVNTDEAINNFILSKTEENKIATKPEELKIKDTTLLVINNHTISSYITTNSEILEKLK